MKPTQKRPPARNLVQGEGPYLTVKDWFGLNQFDTHSTLLPGQFRDAKNIDLYKGSFKSRKGSTNLNDTAATLASEPILESVVWDVGDKEYAIIQCDTGSGSKMRFVELGPDGTFDDVTFKGSGGTATLSSDAPCSMFIKAARCFVFHEEGNHIIQYLPDTETFEMRSMGLTAPGITSVSAIPAGNKSGRFIYGIEKVYQEDGVDIVASSPSRIMTSGALAEITLDGENAGIQVDSTTLETGGGPEDNWTHVKLYKSGNLNDDWSDPSEIRVAEGTEFELFYVKTVARADLISALYVITDNVDHDLIDRQYTWTIDPLGIASRLELAPLPAGKIGTFHKERIWVGRCPTEDPTESVLYYSNFAGDQYCEAYDPLQRFPVEEGDGQKLVAVMPYENNLLVIKEGKTGIILDGNPDIPFQTLDHHQGISHKRLCQYVPSIGICAITTDNSDFKIFDASLRWINAYGSQEISRMVRTLTKDLADDPDFVSFTFVNGKLKIWDGVDTALVLHVEQGKGWTIHQYPIDTSGCEAVVTFAGNSRECILSSEAYLMETEMDLDTDLDTTTGLTNSIAVSWTSHRFQSNEGRDLLKQRSLSLSGTLSTQLVAVPFVNGLSHPIPETEEETAFIPNPIAYADQPELREGVYRLFLQRKPIAPYIHFQFSTEAPCTVRSLDWLGVVTKNMPWNKFNRIRLTKSALYQPEWLVNPDSIIDAGDDDRVLAEYSIYDSMDSDLNDRDITDFSIIEHN